jgi:hypothetical protein
MIKTIIREHHWPPHVIDNLFLDDQDNWGLEYIYNDILDAIEKMKAKKPK